MHEKYIACHVLTLPVANAGPQLLHLYRQWKTSLPFALSHPPLSALTDVANAYTAQRDWNAAMDVAHDLAAQQPALAADMCSQKGCAKAQRRHVLLVCGPALAAGS